MVKILDLTKPLDNLLEIYSHKSYRDPDFSCVEWSSIETQGYRVSAIALGTQTGTHIDAPSHFNVSGKCLEDLPLENLMGQYFLIDLPKNVNESEAASLTAPYHKEKIFFLRSHKSGSSTLSPNALNVLLSLAASVWVLAGEIVIENSDALEFHRRIALRSKYLIENLNSSYARQVKVGGELFALPLALVGTSGAPCRVLVRES